MKLLFILSCFICILSVLSQACEVDFLAQNRHKLGCNIGDRAMLALINIVTPPRETLDFDFYKYKARIVRLFATTGGYALDFTVPAKKKFWVYTSQNESEGGLPYLPRGKHLAVLTGHPKPGKTKLHPRIDNCTTFNWDNVTTRAFLRKVSRGLKFFNCRYDQKSCKRDCSVDPINRLCASNGVTYDNQCYFDAEKCVNPYISDVEILYEGKCGCNPLEPCNDTILPFCGSDGVDYQSDCDFRAAYCDQDQEISYVHDGPCTCFDKYKCEDVIAPACGSDRVTYANECLLNVAACNLNMSITKLYDGRCRDPTECLDIYVCPRNVSIVCGTDGISYLNECVMNFTACYEHREIEVWHPDLCTECPTGEAVPACPVNPCRSGACTGEHNYCISNPCSDCTNLCLPSPHPPR